MIVFIIIGNEANNSGIRSAFDNNINNTIVKIRKTVKVNKLYNNGDKKLRVSW